MDDFKSLAAKLVADAKAAEAAAALAFGIVERRARELNDGLAV